MQSRGIATYRLRAASVAVVFIFSIGLSWAGTVEVEGSAPGDRANAREQALADALREAVRVGAGVDILGTSKISDFTLEYDRVLESAFGYVKSYKILSSGLGKLGLYSVRIRASVEKGTPEAKDSLALRQIMLRKGAPRVSFHVRETIDGSESSPSLAQAVMEESARDLQFHLVDSTSAAVWREGGAPAKTPPGSDFIILGDIVVRHAGQQSFYGSNPRHVFAVGGELRAIRPETGEMVVVDTLEESEQIVGIEPPAMAAREAIRRALAPRKTGGTPALLNKVVARWVVETDLGTIIRLNFSEMPSEEFRKIQAALSTTPKISAVWPRFASPTGQSVIDVETRLDSNALGEMILDFSGGRRKIEYASGSLLAFRDTKTSLGDSLWKKFLQLF